MINLAIIWALFSFIFFCLCVFHFIQSGMSYQLFVDNIKKEDGVEFHNQTANSNEIRIEKFITDFNKYISQQNKSNKHANRMAGFGYMASSIISVFSMLMALEIKLW